MQDFEFFYGAAIIRVIHSNRFKSVKVFGKGNSSYLIDDKIGLYIKYCKNRMPPWRFTFEKEHVGEIKEMFSLLGNVFVALICNDNGICCLNWEEFNTVISIENNNYPKSIKTSRKKNEKYSVSGTDGNLKHKIGNSDFPEKLNERKSQD